MIDTVYATTPPAMEDTRPGDHGSSVPTPTANKSVLKSVLVHCITQSTPGRSYA